MSELLWALGATVVGLVPWLLLLRVLSARVDCPADHLIYTWGRDASQFSNDFDPEVDFGDPRDRLRAVDVYRGPRTVHVVPPRAHATVPVPPVSVVVCVANVLDRDGRPSRLRGLAVVELSAGRDSARRAGTWLLATTLRERTQWFERIAELSARRVWAELEARIAEADPQAVDRVFGSKLEDALQSLGYTARDCSLRPNLDTASPRQVAGPA